MTETTMPHKSSNDLIFQIIDSIENVAKDKILSFSEDEIKDFVLTEPGKETNFFKKAVEDAGPVDKLKNVVIVTKYQKNKGKNLPLIFRTVLICMLIFCFALLFYPLNKKYIKNQKKEDEKLNQENRAFLKLASLFLIPNKHFWAPPLILYLIIGGFLWLAYLGIPVMNPIAVELLEAGGLRKPEIIDGEYWRIFTHIFLHAGFYHIIYNLMSFFFTTFLFSFNFSNKWYLAVFILSGVISGASGLFWYPNTVMIGASGAIMGLSGFLLTVTNFYKEFNKNKILVNSVLLPMVVLTLFFGLIGNANNVAHISGLLTGSILGYLFMKN